MNRDLTTHELERRMRPGWLSEAGFLGEGESLEEVVARDEQTLEELGLSHEQVATSLTNVLSSLFEEHARSSSLPILRNPRSIPEFSLNNLPSLDLGCIVDNLQILFIRYRGGQACPWGCEVEPRWSSFDFLIINRETGEYFTGPSLIIHLIREHHFFEGHESPYRTDPTRASRVLGLLADDDR